MSHVTIFKARRTHLLRLYIMLDGNEHISHDFFLTQEFQKELAKARRIMIVGNGGIALELA